jgi:hypothetical protein
MTAKQMTCGRALMILIGEAGDDPRADLVAARLHASRCPHCNAVYDPAPPDTGTLPVDAEHERGAATTLRVALFAIAVAQLVLAIPWLFGTSLLPDSHVAVAHLTRDGALGLVIASLGLVTAWRPRYVHSTRLIGLLVLGLQLVAGLADREMRSVRASFEVVHLIVVLIVLGLFAVAADRARRATPHATARFRVLRTPPRRLGDVFGVNVHHRDKTSAAGPRHADQHRTSLERFLTRNALMRRFGWPEGSRRA